MPQNQSGAQRKSLFQAIAAQNSELARLASVNEALGAQNASLRATSRRQAGQIETLARGLQALTSAFGPEAEKLVTTAMRRTADVQNPAQPIPEPPAQPAPFDTVTTKTPEAMESPQNPGQVPGASNDVAADATTTVYQPGADIEGPALSNLVDVTAPVDGTQGPRPLEETRTLTDVRAGDPMNMSQAFPLRGDFAQSQRLNPGGRQASRQEDAGRRTMAALRLVEARAATGDDEAASGNRYALAAAIEKDATLRTEDIEAELNTLDKVARRTASREPSESQRHLVPRAASGEPHGARLHSTASYSGHAVSDEEMDASDLFL